MASETTRRDFLLGGTLATAGLVAAGPSPAPGQEQPAQPKPTADKDYPRYHTGPGGPVGSPTDRGKLVPGLRGAGEPPVPVEVPDLPKLAPKRVDGVQEFHLHAQPVKCELLPNFWSNHWGFNGTMPGPVLEVTEGDRIRIVLHNELPEPTSLHL